jgi:hypothetical protein
MANRNDVIRRRLFPNERSYNQKQGMYAGLPVVLRRVQRLFEPRAWQVYTYVVMRADPQGLCWFPLSEMCFDLGFESPAKLRVWVRKLTDVGWLRTASSGGKDYYFVRSPIDVLEELLASGKLQEDVLIAVNETLASGKLATLGDKAKGPPPPDDELLDLMTNGA